MELKAYFKMIWNRKWMIAVIVTLTCIAVGVKSYFFTVPVYQASSRLVVNQSVEAANGVRYMDLTQIRSNITLIKTYIEIIKSSAIMDIVASSHPELGLTSEQLSSAIRVSAANDSQVMNLTMTSVSYERAAQAVNAVAKVFQENISQIMNVDNVTVLDEAKVDGVTPVPVNSSPIFSIVISFLVSLGIAIGVALFIDYLDDTIKNEADIEQLLGLPAIAFIPRFDRGDLKAKKSTASSTNQQVGDPGYVPAKQ